jgi:hypothetical protein
MNSTSQYQHKTLQEINSNYIKDLFKFFCYEYTNMYKDKNRIKEALAKHFVSEGLILNWKITVDGPTLSEVRDTTIHNILNEDNKRYPIKIEFMFQQSKALDIEMCEFIIE